MRLLWVWVYVNICVQSAKTEREVSGERERESERETIYMAETMINTIPRNSAIGHIDLSFFIRFSFGRAHLQYKTEIN